MKEDTINLRIAPKGMFRVLAVEKLDNTKASVVADVRSREKALRIAKEAYEGEYSNTIVFTYDENGQFFGIGGCSFSFNKGRVVRKSKRPSSKFACFLHLILRSFKREPLS